METEEAGWKRPVETDQPNGGGLALVAPQEALGEACYALATALASDGSEQEKGPQPWQIASLGDWRGVRDSNPLPPCLSSMVLHCLPSDERVATPVFHGLAGSAMHHMKQIHSGHFSL